MPAPLHSPHLPALHGERPANVICGCCLLRGRPSVAVCFEACAGRRIRRLCLPAVPVLQAVFCLPCHLCLPCPLPFSTFLPPFKFALPRSVHFALPLFSPCAPGSSCVEPTCLQAARLSRWQLQHGPAVAACAPGPFCDCFLFPADSMILVHGGSVKL